MKLQAVAAAALVLVAGCSAGVLDADSTATTPPPSATTAASTPSPSSTATTATPTTTTTTAATASAVPTTTLTPTANNQWGHNPVTVAVAHPAAGDRNVTPLVRAALAYWSNHSRRYAGVDVTFALRPNATDPDVRVAFTDRLPRCGDDTGDYLGCAPVIEPGTTPPDTVRVEILAGYADRTTRATLTHELGHVLGLDHDDAPQPLMDATARYAATLPKPNATALPLPWRNRTLAVYVQNDAGVGHRSQVEHALAYFESGADGTLAVTPNFTLVSSPERADVTIRLYDTPEATDALDDAGSVARVYGRDPDEDGALEYYTNATVVVAGIDNDASGWHVARWLAYALGYRDGEYPPPLVDADYDDRRSDWWE